MQFFAGQLWRIVYGVSLLQVAFPHIFRYAHFPFIAVLNLATLRREEPCTQGFAICKQGTNFFYATAARVYPVYLLWGFLRSNFISVR